MHQIGLLGSMIPVGRIKVAWNLSKDTLSRDTGALHRLPEQTIDHLLQKDCCYHGGKNHSEIIILRLDVH